MADKHTSSTDFSSSPSPAAGSAGNRSIVDRSGLIILDKPAGASSHDMVSAVRRVMGTKKVGHSGTLDPMATGVLVLGVERGTKFLAHVVTHDKRYSATIALGGSTLTDDAEGKLLSEASPARLREFTQQEMAAALDEAFESFRGPIMQRPTSVSSIKVNGRRAHELVREGKEVNLPARPVEVFSLNYSDVRLEQTPLGLRWLVDVNVHCSSGTYIRAIARDLGDTLGLGGYLTRLRRLTVGPFSLEDAVTIEELGDTPALNMSLDEAMSSCFPVREISEQQAVDLSLGKWLEPIGLEGLHAAVTEEGKAIALIRERGQRAASEFVARPHGL